MAVRRADGVDDAQRAAVVDSTLLRTGVRSQRDTPRAGRDSSRWCWGAPRGPAPVARGRCGGSAVAGRQLEVGVHRAPHRDRVNAVLPAPGRRSGRPARRARGRAPRTGRTPVSGRRPSAARSPSTAPAEPATPVAAGRPVGVGRRRCRTDGRAMGRMDEVLERFSPGDPGVVRRRLRRAHRRRRPARGRRSAPAGTRWSSRPTGSGKTLAAFLWALDRLADRAAAGRAAAALPGALRLPAQGARRRRRAQPARPLAGIRQAAARLGLPEPGRHRRRPVRRHPGRRAPAVRDQAARHPHHHAESLFLMLTSQARESLRGVETVIVDEVHAVAGTKRGAHLALSLERLDALLDRPAQRIGLSATVRPVEEVARFLGGGRDGHGRAAAGGQDASSSRSSSRSRTWPSSASPTGELERRRPAASRSARRSGRTSRSASSTSSRRTARPSCSPTPAGSPSGCTARLNEIGAERGTASAAPEVGSAPAAADGAGRAPPAAPPPSSPAPTTARSAKEQRALIEEELKAGRLPASSRPAASSSASTWARSTWSSRSSRRRRSRAGCSGSAGPATRSARSPAA